ncbi:MAG: hypothetical protein ACM3U2_13930, partial [Deltaproteobacteria bacterium]
MTHSARGARRICPRAPLMALWLAAASLVGPAGCSPKSALAPIVISDEQVAPDALVIPGNRPWVDTGIDVVAGQPLTVVGKGRIVIGRIKKPKEDAERDVGPKGTFFYGNKLTEEKFP